MKIYPAVERELEQYKKERLEEEQAEAQAISEKEQKWKDLYLKCGNATAAVMQVWPEMAPKNGSCRTKGHNLLVKFGIKGKTTAHERVAKKNVATDPQRIVEYVKKQAELGVISVDELFDQMKSLALKSLSDQVKFNALRELKEWTKEAEDEISAAQLSEMEITTLLVNAMSDLPRFKYIEVLNGVRIKRAALIKERGIIYDADKVREYERQKMMSGRATH